MSAENKVLMHRFYDEVLNKGNLEAIDKFITTNIIDHNPFPGQAPGIEGAKQYYAMLRAAFPDLQITIEDQIAEDDKVVS
jgi:predicted SnoaL-like aldol condensation-catalyzing enzyme